MQRNMWNDIWIVYVDAYIKKKVSKLKNSIYISLKKFSQTKNNTIK